VVSVTDGSGAATWQASYEAFGKRTEENGPNTERQRANTKDEDPTGLLNEGFRYRDLEAGVFISRDPLGFVDGPNVYAYVAQNPWSRFDPEGLSFKDMFDVIRMEGIGGTLRTMGNSVYNDVFGDIEASATQGAYLAGQTGSTAEGIGYAAFSAIGGKDLMEADKGRELTFAADGGVSTRQLSGEEMKSKAISGTLKLGATTISAVTGGISTTRTTVGLTEKVVANVAKKEVGRVALDTNAIIARLEGNAADQLAVTTAMAGRSPRLSITAIKEFLKGGGDISSLRSFLSKNNGGVAKAAESNTVSSLMGKGLKRPDANVVGSSIREGTQLLTRDKKILKKVPDITEKF